MKLLLVAIVVIFAVAVAKAVDHLAQGAPVTLSHIRWNAKDRSCTVMFRAHNHTLTPRTAAVFVTLHHPEGEGAADAAGAICGSSVFPVKLNPLEARTVTVEVPSSRPAAGCDVHLEQGKSAR